MNEVCRSCGVSWAILSVLLLAWGCTSSTQGISDGEAPGDDVRQQIEEEFGVLTEDQIASFERELAAQYRQLELTYNDFDALRGAAPEELENSHEEHRTHRRLKRRHQRLARLHEDRMWLHAKDGRKSSEDRHLAEAHRAAASWHEERFEADGVGVVEQDSELEVLRRTIHHSQPAGVDVRVVPAGD